MDKRVADIVVDFLQSLGVDTIFTVTGGGAMFLNDALALNTKIKTICNHHEQASAMAALGYAKYKNDFGAAIFTTGCGVTNSLTGLLDAWQDSNPCIFISGQVKLKETSNQSKVKLRNFGVQEANIIPVVESITKYSVMITDPKDILFELQKAAFIAKNGRPGPVWLDIPMDIQGAPVNFNKLKRFKPQKKYLKIPEINNKEFQFILNKLKAAKRPIIIAGNGIRLGGATELFRKFIAKYKIPFVTSYLSIDLIPSTHNLNIGRLGIKGDRAANFAIQNSDLVISLGSRLSVPLTGFEYSLFAREAYKIVIDIDSEEHKKNTIKIDKFFKTDIKSFFNLSLQPNKSHYSFRNWASLCKKWKKQWPVCLPQYFNDKKINKYVFINELSSVLSLKSKSSVVSDAGSSYYVTSQSLMISSKTQRYITSGAQADMGFTLPAAIGVYFAQKNNQVYGITGDGSLQMNIQELQTLVHNKIPIKLVVWNNNGYLSIRTTQKKFFKGREIGTDSSSGISFPDLKKIAKAYGIDFVRFNTVKQLKSNLKKFINHKKPIIIEILNPENQEIVPTASSLRLPTGKMISKPLEDMYPFLNRDEFFQNMVIKPIDEENSK